MPEALAGVFAPVLTPFTSALAPDVAAFTGLCRWLLAQGSGLAVFGTNSEANSMSVGERIALLDALIASGLPANRMMPGTGACALSDAVTLCRAAARAKTAAVLMLPPFYYKAVSDDGLFTFYAETIERVGDADLKICLYHIPQVSGVPITHSLIEMLLRRYPKTVVGIKDSGGDFTHTRAMLDAFKDFRVFCGSERFLLDTMRHGGAGCISACVNVNPAAIVSAWRHYADAGAEESQAKLNQTRGIFERYPMIAALKRAAAHYGRHESFCTVRPPLRSLDESQSAGLLRGLESAGFAMPGLCEALAKQ